MSHTVEMDVAAVAERAFALVAAGARTYSSDDALAAILEIPVGYLEDESIEYVIPILVRLAGGSLRWDIERRPVVATKRTDDVGDTLAALRQLVGELRELRVRAGTLARWFRRKPTRILPDDLTDDLRDAAPNWGVLFTLPPRDIPLDELVEIKSGPDVPGIPPLVRTADGPTADGALADLTDFDTWRSDAQRVLVRWMLDDQGPKEMLGVLPTGGGKSLTFLLPALVRTQNGRRPGLTVVVTPIIALMNDQVQQAHARFADRAPDFVVLESNGTVRGAERTDLFRRLFRGGVHVLYLSPETLLDPWFLNVLMTAPAPLQHFVVDEVHMVEEWGEEFRCDFQRLGAARLRLLEAHPGMRTLLLSATLGAETRKLVLAALRCPGAAVAEHSEHRPELCFGVHRFADAEERDDALLPLLRSLPRPGIIYCTRTESCTWLLALLREARIRSCAVYFGATDPVERRRVLNDFQAGLLDIIVATNAFGLGVDKPDVRFVLHYQTPGSIERYCQEAGRAGRDGAEAHALLLYVQSEANAAAKQEASRLSTQKVAGRFHGMWRARTELPDGGVLLDPRIVPDYAGGGTVEIDAWHAAWNEVALNAAERAGVLTVEGHVAVRLSGGVAQGDRPEHPLEARLHRNGDTDLVEVARAAGTSLHDVQAAFFRLGAARLLAAEPAYRVLVRGVNQSPPVEARIDANRARERARALAQDVRERREFSHPSLDKT